ncbi:calcium-binding protein [Sphingobium sp. WCS2017Hpa-17]|uniref:beta strand repeat-containing protein n=1 Tax=Sphingobium sp. WCS2017Hpa-17 TaxID=3073638 RepID=UPI002889B17C|nr:calcium-binding protein [Sphingobium sp. WCS2017Hpa-17]
MATFTGNPNTDDNFVGTDEDDIFIFNVSDLNARDIVSGGGGFNTLRLSGSGSLSAVQLSGVSGIDRIVMETPGLRLTIPETMISTIWKPGYGLQIAGSSGNDYVDAHVLFSGRHIDVTAGSGLDVFLGGGSADVFRFRAEDLDGDTVNGGGRVSGDDILYITTAGTVTASAFANVSNISKIVLAEGTNSLTLGDYGSARLNIVGGNGNDHIDASLANINSLSITAGGGVDSLIGVNGINIFTLVDLNGDTVVGGSGNRDEIILRTQGVTTAADMAYVRGIEKFTLANGTNLFILADTLAVGLGGKSITVVGGTGNDTIDGSAISDEVNLTIDAGTGNDVIKGGAGNDIITVTWDGRDSVDGGAGVDRLSFDGAQSAPPLDVLANVSAVENINIYGGKLINLYNNMWNGISTARITISSSGIIDGSSLTANHAAEFIVYSDAVIKGGAGADIFRISSPFSTTTGNINISGGGGADTAYLTWENVTLNTSDLANVRGIETFILARGRNHITIDDAIFRDVGGRQITFVGNDGSDFIDASALSALNSIQVTSHIGLDTLIGGAGNDIFHFMAEKLDGDAVIGNGGYDTLSIGTAGTVTAEEIRNVSGVERIMLAAGQNSIALTDANVAGLANNRIEIWGQSGNDSVDASALSRAYGIDTRSGGGNDSLTGGAGTDIFRFNIADLNSGDSVSGGGWADQLILIGGGSLSANDLSGVRGVETIILWGGPAQITLADSLFRDIGGGRITIQGSSNADRIDGSSLSAGHSILAVGGNDIDQIIGGAGNDRIQGGAGADILTGGGGRDQFVWSNASEGGDSILDFVIGQDQLVFNPAAFGVNGAALDVRSTDAAGDLSTTDLLVYDGILDDSAAVRSLLGGNDSTVDAGLFVVARDADNHSVLYYTASADGSGANAGVHMIADLGAIAPASLGVSDFLIG